MRVSVLDNPSDKIFRALSWLSAVGLLPWHNVGLIYLLFARRVIDCERNFVGIVVDLKTPKHPFFTTKTPPSPNKNQLFPSKICSFPNNCVTLQAVSKNINVSAHF